MGVRSMTMVSATLAAVFALGVLAALSTAVQVPPKSVDTYPVEGVCGTWSLGIPPLHPECRPVSTGGGGLHAENLLDIKGTIGPEARGLRETYRFNGTKFFVNTEYWSDAPCFAGKPYCFNWDPVSETCKDTSQSPPPDCEWYTAPAQLSATPWKDVWSNAAKKSDASQRTTFCVCPLYQNHAPGSSGATDCSAAGKQSPGRAACPSWMNCGCKSEEYYAGCGAISGYGQKIETLEIQGE